MTIDSDQLTSIATELCFVSCYLQIDIDDFLQCTV